MARCLYRSEKVPICQRLGTNRGCCHSHYNMLGKAVRAGKTTWEQLMAEGLCLPPADRKTLAWKQFRFTYRSKKGA